jgi:tRNA dimethylallyltransferase
METPLIAIVGPTASGKTAVGVALAEQLNGEIVSADAVAVYRRLDIGAAKPDAEERRRAEFHLVDVAEPEDDFSLTDFVDRANLAIASIRARGKTPILVGGTGLYVRAVTATLSVPNIAPNEEIRAALWAESEARGSAVLHSRLAQVDSASAEKILPGDAKRIIRALEVYLVAGRPMSSFHTPEGVRGVPKPNTYQFGLSRERPELYRRIERRVGAMIDRGFIAEVEGLLQLGCRPELKSMQSLGYRHLCKHIVDSQPLDESIVELRRDTRRYAKRQLSWFGNDPGVLWRDVAEEETAEAVAGALIDQLNLRVRAK